MKHLTRLIFLLSLSSASLRAENILLISIDTLRADRLSCYGYRGIHTPGIDRLAAEGVRFENAFTEYPLTLPAHSTLLTGTYPFRHGVRENVGFALGKDQPTLASILKQNGYSTAGFIGSYVLASQFGLSQGFDTYDEKFGAPLEKVLSATALRRSAEQVTDTFLTWLAAHRGNRFFAFVHFYDPHAPCPNGYDSEIVRVDRSVGRIDAYLRKWNLLEQTHIFLVSDHGESLGEHGESGHGFFLYDCTLHVPLIVRPAAGFAVKQKVVKPSVSLADVMPTILQMAGIPDHTRLQGRSLVRMIMGKEAGEAGIYSETYVPQLHFGWSPLRCYRLGHYKWIDAPRPELYNLSLDPGERVNLISSQQALANQYRVQLEEFTARNQGGQDSRATSGPVLEASEKLAALGYVRLGSMRIRSEFGRGIDPKDRIAVHEAYHGVLNDLGNRNVTNGVFERIDSIRRQAPELRGLAFLEARAFEGLGRLQDAYVKYQEGLAQEPANAVARADMANLMLHMGKTDEAEREFRQVLNADPGDYRSRNNLAGLYSMKGKTDQAIAELKKALATRPSYAAAWHNLGRLHAQAGDWSNAEAALRKAFSLDPADAGAHLLLAQVLKAMGRAAEANQQMRRAQEIDPGLARHRQP